MNLDFLSHRAKLGATNLHPFGRPATAWLLSALDLHADQRVLEIGCGTGETMLRVASEHAARVDAVDVLPEMLKTARLRLALAGLSKHVALHRLHPDQRLPFDTASYDRAYTESVLGFQSAATATLMLSEIFRVLKPGGLFAANEAIWREGVTADEAARLHRAETEMFGLARASKQPWSVNEWLAVMHAVGFEVVSARPLDDLASLDEVQERRRAPRSTIASRLVTAICRFRGYVDPALRAERAKYDRLLRTCRLEREYIEARLFVLRKPNELASQTADTISMTVR